jgi:tetratricopeptide (TPR) repeat protein
MAAPMSPAVKRLLSVAVVAAAAMAIHFFCVKPLMCGIAEKRLERSTLRLAQRPDSYAVRRQAAANLDSAVACIRVQPDNVNLYMIAAANCRLLAQPHQAIDFYERALHYDRRRELFANLGNVQSEIGMKNEAIENLTRANIFWADSIIDIEDPFVHDEVLRRYNEYEARMKRAVAASTDR